jgi:PAS domain S-box-containing protein
MEEALARERNLLRSLIDNVPDYIYVKDTESRFITCNPSLVRLMGVATPDDIVGKTDFDFYPPELAAKYFADEQAIFQSDHPLLEHEEPVVDVAGKPGWISTTKVPLRDAHGKVFGLVGMGRDITERKQAEAEREQLVQDIQARAHREQILREVTARVRSSTDPDTILRIAIRELGTALGRPSFVRLGSAEQLSQAGAGNGDDAAKEGGA